MGLMVVGRLIVMQDIGKIIYLTPQQLYVDVCIPHVVAGDTSVQLFESQI